MKSIALAALLAAAPAVAFAGGVPGQHFVENWDLDGNGSVSVEEATERRGNVFLTFDADDNGFLDAEEYALFDEARANDMKSQGGHGRGTMKRAADGMKLAANDLDKDGLVSRDEFVSQASVWIENMDENGDGVITTEDFAMRRGGGMGQGHGKKQGG
ncbi:EF-hand domain-containing protein [Pacificoceanicola onchidii]|uniref:EF-hand domain-containing protein n=1 Tax=Pacificoceanicola onchidii TaxID=2562685 RepID=UPI0010A4378B|nr:EF-hand domain-containing protein [Pacificoceanicola onchidii]